MNTSLTFSSWNTGQVYSKFDVIWGANTGDNTYYYSTISNNSGCPPQTTSVNVATGASRNSDIATIYFLSGYFSAKPSDYNMGSIVEVYCPQEPSFNYTGMLLDAGGGYVRYLNAGYNTGFFSLTGAINTLIGRVHPNWTTGFFFVPSYTTSVETQQAVILAQFEPGYEQRQPQSINNNADTWTLNFLDRSDKETRAIRNFVQSMGGVYSFPIMIPVSSFDNEPDQLYVGTGPRITQKSWNLNDSVVTVRRVFDPQ